MIEAVIFDLDGLLIDSEPLWRKAEIEVYNRLGITFTEAMSQQTTGMRNLDAVAYWHQRYQWRNPNVETVAAQIISEVEQLVDQMATEKQGATALIQNFHSKHLPMAICSSSPATIIAAVTKKLNIDQFFQLLHSAEREEHGKPHPAAYLTCAKELNTDPEKCLVFEDSLTGAIAAKAARMKVIAVPEDYPRQISKFSFCDMTLESLNQFQSFASQALFNHDDQPQ